MKNDDHGRLNIVTRRGTRLAGLDMPKVHGHDKSLDPSHKPEHQKVKPVPRPIPQPVPKNTGAITVGDRRLLFLNFLHTHIIIAIGLVLLVDFPLKYVRKH